mgnify:CR=1 FL=1
MLKIYIIETLSTSDSYNDYESDTMGGFQMTYRELLELTKKHPNPFRIKERRDKELENRYTAWLEQQNQATKTYNSKERQKKY